MLNLRGPQWIFMAPTNQNLLELIVKLYIYLFNMWKVWGPSRRRCCTQMGCSIKYPKIDGVYWKILLKWMIWGYPSFRKPPNFCLFRCCSLSLQGTSAILRGNWWWFRWTFRKCMQKDIFLFGAPLTSCFQLTYSNQKLLCTPFEPSSPGLLFGLAHLWLV